MSSVCLFCESDVTPHSHEPFAYCSECQQMRQLLFIETEEETPYIGAHVVNYYIDVEKSECVVQVSDGDYRFPLPKRKDGYALEQMLLAACVEHNLDYCSEDHVEALVQNAVDSFWYGMKAKRAKVKAAQA